MLRKVLITLFVLTLPVIVTAETRVDFDRHKDFSRYKTFTLEVDPPIRADGVVDEFNTLAENRIRQAVMREFQARGLEATDVGADLTVHVSSRETEQTVLLSSGLHDYRWGWSGRRWGYRGYPRYWGYPGHWGYWGPYAGDVWTGRYLEGSLTIDIVEHDTGDLVYRAQVIDEIGSNLEKQVTQDRRQGVQEVPDQGDLCEVTRTGLGVRRRSEVRLLPFPPPPPIVCPVVSILLND